MQFTVVSPVEVVELQKRKQSVKVFMHLFSILFNLPGTAFRVSVSDFVSSVTF